MINLTAAEILATLDLDAVESAILNDENGKPQLLAHQFEDAKRMAWTAAEKWLVSDLNMLDASSLRIEEKFNIQLGGYPVRGFLDLRGQYKSGADRGKVVIADWKTTVGALDLTWQNRLVDSKQWKLYSIVPPGAEFIEYRGVNIKGATRSVYLQAWTMPDLQEKVETYFGSIGTMQASLADRDIWPQSMPGACGQYGQVCPFLEGPAGCRSGSPPKYLLPASEIALSYSGAGRFLACPEKFRRLKRAEAGLDSTDSTRLGVCTHRGLQEIYIQSFKKYGD
jgi:hypothetical protein